MSDDLKVGGVKDRRTIVAMGAYWKDQRWDYTNNLPVYRGVHYLHNAPTDNTNWEIWKYSYSGTDLTNIQGPLSGAWDDRASLGWT